jgi:glycerol-3-phosphate acyltransferase PlsY
VLKGLLPPLAAHQLGLSAAWEVAAGIAAISGHNWSPFLGFQGGKGVSTSLGVLFGVAWKVGLAAWALWAVVLGIFGFVSLGSVVAAVSLIPFTLLFYPADTARIAFAVIACLFTIYRHRANIQRLRDGTESSFKKKPKIVQ